MIGYQIPISLSPPEDCFGEHLEAGWLKGLHSCASVSAFRGTDTRPLPGKEAEPALGGLGGPNGSSSWKVCAPAVQSRTFLSCTYLRVELVEVGGGPVVSLTRKRL